MSSPCSRSYADPRARTLHERSLAALDLRLLTPSGRGSAQALQKAYRLPGAAEARAQRDAVHGQPVHSVLCRLFDSCGPAQRPQLSYAVQALSS